MRQKPDLLLSGALIVTAWVLFAFVLGTVVGLVSKPVFFAVYLCLAAALTWRAGELLAREWRGTAGRFSAALVSGLAAASIVWLADWYKPVSYQASGPVLFLVLPFALGFLTTAFTLGRWPNSDRWMVLVGAVLWVGFSVVGTRDHDSVDVAVMLAGVAYIAWLLGVRAGVVRVQRREKAIPVGAE